jgi:hypothetical protein
MKIKIVLETEADSVEALVSHLRDLVLNIEEKNNVIPEVYLGLHACSRVVSVKPEREINL